MSLDINACVKRMTEKDFKKKFGFEPEEVDSFLEPEKDDFFYRLHPEFFDKDWEKYQKMVDAYNDIDRTLHTFHIGYASFHALRVNLALLLHMKFNVNGWESTSFDWGNLNLSDDENKALKDFFSHSDCDGDMSIAHVHYLNKVLNPYKDKIEKLDVSPERKEEIASFIKFLNQSDQDKCYWLFY